MSCPNCDSDQFHLELSSRGRPSESATKSATDSGRCTGCTFTVTARRLVGCLGRVIGVAAGAGPAASNASDSESRSRPNRRSRPAANLPRRPGPDPAGIMISADAAAVSRFPERRAGAAESKKCWNACFTPYSLDHPHAKGSRGTQGTTDHRRTKMSFLSYFHQRVRSTLEGGT